MVSVGVGDMEACDGERGVLGGRFEGIDVSQGGVG